MTAVHAVAPASRDRVSCLCHFWDSLPLCLDLVNGKQQLAAHQIPPHPSLIHFLPRAFKLFSLTFPILLKRILISTFWAETRCKAPSRLL
jgi:hypothetical protein